MHCAQHNRQACDISVTHCWPIEPAVTALYALSPVYCMSYHVACAR
jgi:hypothetical protein